MEGVRYFSARTVIGRIMDLFKKRRRNVVQNSILPGHDSDCMSEDSSLGAFSLEKLRRIRSMEGDFSDLGFDIYDVKLLKARSSKAFFK